MPLMAEPDPVYDLWERTRRALAPFGIEVGGVVLMLWRDQHARGAGPFWAVERGDPQAVDELIESLRVLRGDGPRPPA